MRAAGRTSPTPSTARSDAPARPANGGFTTRYEASDCNDHTANNTGDGYDRLRVAR
jgi:hypothetical protein